jgi:hypothetical protein
MVLLQEYKKPANQQMGGLGKLNVRGGPLDNTECIVRINSFSKWC